LQRLRDQRFEAIVLDTADLGEALLVLDSIKNLPSCKNSLRIVLADRQATLASAFSTGIHLVIYRPISPDRLRNYLRGLCNLIGRRYKREFGRIRVKIPAILQIGEKNHLQASILDISQGGVAFLSQQSLPTKTLVFRFVLPGRTEVITTSAEVVWNDVRGRMGAQFVNMESGSRKILTEWVSAQLSSNRLRKGAVTSRTLKSDALLV
jgi:PilZ domain